MVITSDYQHRIRGVQVLVECYFRNPVGVVIMDLREARKRFWWWSQEIPLVSFIGTCGMELRRSTHHTCTRGVVERRSRAASRPEEDGEKKLQTRNRGRDLSNLGRDFAIFQHRDSVDSTSFHVSMFGSRSRFPLSRSRFLPGVSIELMALDARPSSLHLICNSKISYVYL